MSDPNGNLTGIYLGGRMESSNMNSYTSSSAAPASPVAFSSAYSHSSSSSSGTGQQGSRMWWEKPVLYKGEMRIYGTNIPLIRTLLSLVFVIALYLGVSFILSLCTDAARFVSSVSLISTIIYAYWALWWEEPVIIPPTISFFFCNHYSTVAAVLCLAYESCLIGMVVFVVALSFIFSSYEIQEIFVWEC